eukprot:1196174-Prorocentrum_minimum.AAC.8
MEETLDRVEAELGVAGGPWFLGGNHPTLVDLQRDSDVKGLERALDVWTCRPLASTWHVHTSRALSSPFTLLSRLYGPGYSDGTPATKAAEEFISGKGAAWRLPLDLGLHSVGLHTANKPLFRPSTTAKSNSPLKFSQRRRRSSSPARGAPGACPSLTD